MRSAVIAAILLVVAYCEARPNRYFNARPSFGASYIVGGVEAGVAEFPWQLSQQRRRADSTWSHSCGASLLSPRYALSAAHCVDGATVDILRVIAGLHDRTASNGVLSNVLSYQKHELYEKRFVAVSDDIAILTLETPIYANGGNIQYATLPDNGDDLFVGQSGFVSGWGRTSGSSTTLPQFLQKASISVISKSACNRILLLTASYVDDTQICLYDEVKQKGSCKGDSGGPFNLITASGQYIVAGVTSWGIGSEENVCFQNFPSVYTRTSAYLDWIKTNTP